MQAVCWGPKAWQSWLHVLAVMLLAPCLNIFGGLTIMHSYLAATGQTTYEVGKGAKVGNASPCKVPARQLWPTSWSLVSVSDEGSLVSSNGMRHISSRQSGRINTRFLLGQHALLLRLVLPFVRGCTSAAVQPTASTDRNFGGIEL